MILAVITLAALENEQGTIEQSTVYTIEELKGYGYSVAYLVDRDESKRADTEEWFKQVGLSVDVVLRDGIFKNANDGQWKRSMVEALVEGLQSSFTVYVDPKRVDRDYVAMTRKIIMPFPSLEPLLVNSRLHQRVKLPGD